jgi:hypothetical protein
LDACDDQGGAESASRPAAAAVAGRSPDVIQVAAAMSVKHSEAVRRLAA